MNGPAARRLIVTADDFGLHAEINAGVEEAHRRGILTHASLMAGGPAVKEAIRLARELPRLGVGVHLTVKSPVSGTPLHYGAFLRHMATRRLTVLKIRRQWREQIAFLRGQGVTLTHMDSHQHLHLFPPLFSVASALAREHGIGRLRVPFSLVSMEGARLLPRLLLSAGVASSLLLARRGRRPPYAEHFRGFDVSGRLTTARLLRIIRALPPGVTEIMCHPGQDTARLEQRLGWGYHWDEELAALTSQQAWAAVRDLRVQLAYPGTPATTPC